MYFRISGLLAVATIVPALALGQSRAATPTLTTLVNFCAATNCPDGANPFAGLIFDADGNLLGTTAGGGTMNGGTVFEIAKTANGYANAPTILVNFCAQFNCTDGAVPEASLIADANANLFGTTYEGGPYEYGTVFEVAKTSNGYASTAMILVGFNGTNGAFPTAGLIFDADGNLFGTTLEGGMYGPQTSRTPADNFGTVFEIAKTVNGYATTPTTLVSFNGTYGEEPHSGVIADANGILFGTTFFGGTNDSGTVFEVAKTSTGYANIPTTLVNFNGEDGGADPYAGLITDANGNLFGTTQAGRPPGTSGVGTVFELNKTAGGYATTPTILAGFTGTNGYEPSAPLIADAKGNLFGTTFVGGPYGYGTVFEVAKTASGYATTPTVLASFNGTNGANPMAGLVADAKGNLFGTTGEGGVYGYGTVFEITGSGFIPPLLFAGMPGKPNCHGKSVSALAQQYGGLAAAAAALGYSSVQVLQNEIANYCAG